MGREGARRGASLGLGGPNAKEARPAAKFKDELRFFLSPLALKRGMAYAAMAKGGDQPK